MSTVQQQKKILLFGKTGDGKSTIANMLVSGKVDGKFAAGDSFAAVTEQTKEFVSDVDSNWTIIDTVGLIGTDLPENDHKRIHALRKHLAKTHNAIDILCYVKKASKFTRADELSWLAFHTLFTNPNYHHNVLLAFTSCRTGWLVENKDAINEFFAVPNCPQERYRSVGVDFPPSDSDDDLIESRLEEKRQASLKALKEAMESIASDCTPLLLDADSSTSNYESPAEAALERKASAGPHKVQEALKGAAGNFFRGLVPGSPKQKHEIRLSK